MRTGFDLAEEELADRGSRRRLAWIGELVMPGVRLALGSGLKLHPERIVSDEQHVLLVEQIRMAERAARAMLRAVQHVQQSQSHERRSDGLRKAGGRRQALRAVPSGRSPGRPLPVSGRRFERPGGWP